VPELLVNPDLHIAYPDNLQVLDDTALVDNYIDKDYFTIAN
jgi:hypothetical protein